MTKNPATIGNNLATHARQPEDRNAYPALSKKELISSAALKALACLATPFKACLTGGSYIFSSLSGTLSQVTSAIGQCFGKELKSTEVPAEPVAVKTIKERVISCVGTALACLTTPFKACSKRGSSIVASISSGASTIAHTVKRCFGFVNSKATV